MKYMILFGIATLAHALPQGTSTTPKKLLPWKEPDTKASWYFECDGRLNDEDPCGTKIYCQMMDWDLEIDKDYKNAKECFDAREPDPKAATAAQANPPAKLPWKEPGEAAIDCGWRAISEEDCGTQFYCPLFDKPWNDGAFKSSKQCFDAHEPQPESKPLDPNRIVFPED